MKTLDNPNPVITDCLAAKAQPILWVLTFIMTAKTATGFVSRENKNVWDLPLKGQS